MRLGSMLIKRSIFSAGGLRAVCLALCVPAGAGLVSFDAAADDFSGKDILSPREETGGFDILNERPKGPAGESDLLSGRGQPLSGNPDDPGLSVADCRALRIHTAGPDTHVQPGAGTGGRKVAPADIAGGQEMFPDGFSIPLTFDIANKYGLGRFGDMEGLASAGTLHVKDGNVTFNGQPLQSESLSGLIRDCNSRYD